MRLPLLLAACSLAALADEPNLLKNPGFEEPAVAKRTRADEGGSPGRAAAEATSWTHLQVQGHPNDQPGGELAVGLTNEFARTGKQSVFVDFQNVSAQRRAALMTDLIPVKAGHLYRFALWGRTDPKRPLTLDQRRPLLKLEFEYFKADPEEQCDRTDYGTQLIPGSLDRIMFLSTKWTEYFRIIRTPEDAAFMKVTIRWETDRAPGTTDGAIYFDDASLVAMPKGESLAPLDPSAPKPPLENDEKNKQ